MVIGGGQGPLLIEGKERLRGRFKLAWDAVVEVSPSGGGHAELSTLVKTR